MGKSAPLHLVFYANGLSVCPMPDQDRTQESNAKSLIQEADRLLSEQDEAISRAVYVGMSVSEAKAYDKRRKRLDELFEKLCILKFQVFPPCKTKVKLRSRREAC